MHIDDWGGTFRATCVRQASDGSTEPIDLTGATVEFLFRRPSGTVESVAATIQRAKKGIAYYTTPEGWLDEIGVWKWQVLINAETWSAYADMQDFTVNEHLEVTA